MRRRRSRITPAIAAEIARQRALPGGVPSDSPLCANCGRPFRADDPEQQYCPECREVPDDDPA